jgi:hypothetical protein
MSSEANGLLGAATGGASARVAWGGRALRVFVGLLEAENEETHNLRLAKTRYAQKCS